MKSEWKVTTEAGWDKRPGERWELIGDRGYALGVAIAWPSGKKEGYTLTCKVVTFWSGVSLSSVARAVESQLREWGRL